MQPRRHSLPLSRQREWRQRVLATTPGLVPGFRAPASSDLVAFETARVSSFFATVNVDDPRELYVAPGEGFPFESEDPAHPALRELRETYALDSIAVGSSDLERVARLSSWVRGSLRHAVPYELPVWDARLILDRGTRGVEDYICLHLVVVLVQCALAIGLQARMVNLHMEVAGGDPAEVSPGGVYCPEHVVAEVWLPDQQRWVMFDPDHDCYYSRDGQALSAWQLHDALLEDALSQLDCIRGPHSVAQEPDGTPIEDDVDEWFATFLPQYYRHVSILMRNDFLSHPDGPTRIAHPVDAQTPPVLWRGGSDLRLNRYFLGPIRVAAPWTSDITLLGDGEYRTCWASDDDETHEQFVEIEFATPEHIAGVTVYWAEFDGVFRTSRRLTIEVITDVVTEIELIAPDEAPFTTREYDQRGVRRIRLRQAPGDGARETPNRLWLTQIEVLRVAHAAD